MTTSTRIERDSLGEVCVPSNALYGAQTQRAIENFPISGPKPRQAFIWSLGIIKKVAAQVNMDLGLLDKEKANAIIQAAQEVIDGKWNEQFVVDPFQARAYLAEVGYDADYGARPLKRAIQRELQDPLAVKILSGEFHEGETIYIESRKGKLEFTAS